VFNDFFIKEANIINENDIILDVTNYFNVDEYNDGGES
jgi:hypothetical protein